MGEKLYYYFHNSVSRPTYRDMMYLDSDEVLCGDKRYRIPPFCSTASLRDRRSYDFGTARPIAPYRYCTGTSWDLSKATLTTLPATPWRSKRLPPLEMAIGILVSPHSVWGWVRVSCVMCRAVLGEIGRMTEADGLRVGQSPRVGLVCNPHWSRWGGAARGRCDLWG